MRASVVVAVAVAVIAACATAPRPIDVAALVRARGAADARRELIARVLADPRDVAARLALAELDERDRPAAALAQLEAVDHLGGPLGTRWRANDRARLGRLLLARGRARAGRGAATALADLERARALGAAPAAAELAGARLAVAIAALRHVDAGERARGRALVRELGAAPTEPGALGDWLWTIGARRESYEQLAAWHATTHAPRDERLQAAYLRALAWWSPIDAPSPPADELVGAGRCWFAPPGCAPAVEPAAGVRVDLVVGDARARAAARYAGARVAGAPDAAALVAIAERYRRDPGLAERPARELVDAAVDGAVAHAALGALYDALGDPARARAAWQAAVDDGDEAGFVRGLAEACARGGDGPAALVFATTAAAAWGDPARVWIGVARALAASGRPVEALVAASSAIELAGRDTIDEALDAGIAASAALGRTAQAEALQARARMAPTAPRGAVGDADATADVRDAIAAHRAHPTAATVARLWVLSRAHPRQIELRAALIGGLERDDARRVVVVDELVALAGQGEGELEAVVALGR